MSVIAVLPASEVVTDDDQLADTRRRTPGAGGGHVPSGLAGYTYDGATYCPDCAGEVEVECADTGETYTISHFPPHATDPHGFGVGVVSGTDEWDYPGATCHVCDKTLETNVLVYDDGGAHPTPVVTVEAKDSDVRGEAAVFGDPDPDADTVEVVWLTDYGPVDRGTVDTVSTEAVTDGLTD